MSKSLPDSNDLIGHIAVFDSRQAYRRLFKTLFPVLYRLCYVLLKSEELAEEIAGEVMIRLWRNRRELPGIHDLRIHAFSLARDLSLNILSVNPKQKLLSVNDIRSDIVLDTLCGEDTLIDDELKGKLEAAMQDLSGQCRLVFRLIREAGLSYQETSAILNISVKTVDIYLAAAVKKLTGVLRTEFKLT